MSVVKMKLLTVAGPVGLVDDVIGSAVLGNRFHLEDAITVNNDLDLYAFPQNDPYHGVYILAAEIAASLNIGLDSEDFSGKDYSAESCLSYLETLQKRLKALSAERLLMGTAISDNSEAIGSFQNIKSLPERLSALLQMNYVKFRFGRMPTAIYDAFVRASDEIDEMFFFPTNTREDFTYGICLLTRGAENHVDKLLSSLRFERIILPYTSASDISEAIIALEKASKSAEEHIAEIDSAIREIAESERSELLSVYSYARYSSEICEVKKSAGWSDDGYFTLSGWVPADELDAVTEKLEQFDKASFVVEDPSSVTDISPPVCLKHNFLSRIFRPFIDLYGLPAYDEIDPTFLLAVTYSIMFGIMYGDLGQGLVLIALGFALYKLKGMWLGRILSSVGVMSCVFGVVFGSVFGYEELIHGFNVLATGQNTTRILLISVAIGVVTIAFMMVINIINGIKQKNYQKIFFDPNGLSGLVLYCSAVIAVVSLLLFDTNLLVPLYIIPLIVLPLLLIFCREPLGKLVSGSKHWLPESFVSFFLESFFELFETILSYVTNTISFLRIGAYAISHAGMMMVVYMLAESGGGYNIAVIVIGNIIVMGIEGLLVCIQVLRLEFYEMFGRFFASGGREFKPQIIDYSTIKS